MPIVVNTKNKQSKTFPIPVKHTGTTRTIASLASMPGYVQAVSSTYPGGDTSKLIHRTHTLKQKRTHPMLSSMLGCSSGERCVVCFSPVMLYSGVRSRFEEDRELHRLSYSRDVNVDPDTRQQERHDVAMSVC